VIVHGAGDGVSVVDALITKRLDGFIPGKMETKAVSHDRV